MKLISMKDFVLGKQEEIHEDWEQNYKSHDVVYSEFLVDRFIDYAAFLNQPLTLGMFITCDEEGNILKRKGQFDADYHFFKEKVLFDVGKIDVHEDSIMFGDDRFIVSRQTGNLIYWQRTAITIEDVANDILVQFSLTPAALKLIGLKF